jgi:hypothetical protein
MLDRDQSSGLALYLSAWGNQTKSGVRLITCAKVRNVIRVLCIREYSIAHPLVLAVPRSSRFWRNRARSSTSSTATTYDYQPHWWSPNTCITKRNLASTLVLRSDISEGQYELGAMTIWLWPPLHVESFPIFGNRTKKNCNRRPQTIHL